MKFQSIANSTVCCPLKVSFLQVARSFSTGVFTRGKMPLDHIYIKNLKVDTATGPGLWNQLDKQHCSIDVKIGTNFAKSAATDDLKYSLNYAVISRDIQNFVNLKQNWVSLSNISQSIYSHLLRGKYAGIETLDITVKNPDYHLRTSGISYQVKDDKLEYIQIKDLELYTLLGVFTFERLQKQKILLDIIIEGAKGLEKHISIKQIIDQVVVYIENANFKTVEALVECVSKLISQNVDLNMHKSFENTKISCKVTKLNAITDTDGVGVSCTRDLKVLRLLDDIHFNDNLVNQSSNGSYSVEKFNLPVQNKEMETTDGSHLWNKAYLAFGSNMGKRLQYIQTALKLLEEDEKVKITNVSSLFESEPMYFKDQTPFMNGAIEILTQLSPIELLRKCKEIEYEELKRVKLFDNGPRCIDLDIILYLNHLNEHILLNSENLIIPHARMLERSFVLEPLCELIPPTMLHPITAEPIIDHLKQIYSKCKDEDILWKLIPLPQIKDSKKKRYLKFKNVYEIDPVTGQLTSRTKSSTYTMGILNTTPDSFSDGGKYYSNLETQLDKVQEMCQDTFKLYDNIIIDIGGCSTRPHSKQATLEEEIERTIPLIKLIRSTTTLPQEKIILSIDTYRSEVAQLAIDNGVDIINDISGGTFDPEILDVVGRNNSVAYVMSHIRGNIDTMTQLTNYDKTLKQNNKLEVSSEYIYGNKIGNDDKYQFISTIGKEMAQIYDNCLNRGIKRWQIIMDPGIGFAKQKEQNLQIIRQLPHLKNFACELKDKRSHNDSVVEKYVNFKNIPVLLGPSRKKFIGTITKDEDATARDYSTCNIISPCIGFDCNIIRVHNVKECVKSIKLSDSIYKI